MDALMGSLHIKPVGPPPNLPLKKGEGRACANLRSLHAHKAAPPPFSGGGWVGVSGLYPDTTQ